MAAAGTLAFDGASVSRLLAQGACGVDEPPGYLVKTLPLTGDRARATPFGTIVGGGGLDARMFTDLSRISSTRLITPTPEVFVRTAPPADLASRLGDWRMDVGPGRPPLDVEELRRLSTPQGAHVIECAGNSDPDNFGLLSAATWDGVPLTTLLPRLAPAADSGEFGVLVSGLDDDAQGARTSIAGASWIVPWADLSTLQPFLATRMNGEWLTPEHGAPVRLVVPGWYGCAWIKWVREMRLVGADAPATTQMTEFATRTHQDGRPELARDYAAPVIDLAATPIRVEQRRVEGRIEYRVVGLTWGGTAPTTRLSIRFNSREPWTPVTVCPATNMSRAWSLWAHRWRPTEPGTYNITLSSPDPAIRTRRLDMFFYARRVRIDEM